VISRDEFNAHSGTFIGLSLTSQEPKVDFPFTYELRATKLPKRSWVKISQIRLLSTERLVGHVGKVDSDELAVIVEGFNEIIGS
jgi:mRNA interferase MazF